MRRRRYQKVIGSRLAFSHAALERFPFVMRWDAARHQLLRRSVRAPARARGVVLGNESPPWLATGPANLPFDFCGHVQRLCADIVARCPELNHIDASKLLFCMTQARTGRVHGLQARVTPLRFRDGALRRRRHGVPYQVQRYIVDGQEMLYLVTFCLPRFLDQEFDGKFVTLFHELYHISSQFEGDLRRHAGRCQMHSHSKRAYDKHMAHLAREYLSGGADPSLHAFLRLNFAQLAHRHGRVEAVVVPRPKLLPIVVPETLTAAASE
jgi:predicted metallopeptidase